MNRKVKFQFWPCRPVIIITLGNAARPRTNGDLYDMTWIDGKIANFSRSQPPVLLNRVDRNAGRTAAALPYQTDQRWQFGCENHILYYRPHSLWTGVSLHSGLPTGTTVCMRFPRSQRTLLNIETAWEVDPAPLEGLLRGINLSYILYFQQSTTNIWHESWEIRAYSFWEIKT